MEAHVWNIKRIFHNLSITFQQLLTEISLKVPEERISLLANLTKLSVEQLWKQTEWIRTQRKKDKIDKQLMLISNQLKEPELNVDEISDFKENIPKLEKEFLSSI